MRRRFNERRSADARLRNWKRPLFLSGSMVGSGSDALESRVVRSPPTFVGHLGIRLPFYCTGFCTPSTSKRTEAWAAELEILTTTFSCGFPINGTYWN